MLRHLLRLARDYIPRGNTLDADTFRHRHAVLCWTLAGHIPALFVYGLWQGFGPSHSGAEIAPPLVALAVGRVMPNRRLAALSVTAGLVFCSSALVHLSGGTIEAHFHFFILIGLIALYQDWVPFLWNVLFTVLSHGLGSAIAADLMYNHHAAQSRPWSWAGIHGAAVLAACIGVIVFWKNTELEQNRSTALAAELAAAEIRADQRQSVSELLVNLARRNQSLLDRQLELITELERSEATPEALGELFRLDHLATRIRRNAESLLVLSGDESPRRWGRPVLLGDVVRAAAAEVEDYQRVDVLVSEHLELAGRAVADVAHLLAELIENATRFSPPTSQVRVRSYAAPDGGTGVVLSVEDVGIGMDRETLDTVNRMLAEPAEVDLRGRTLGFHVVGRLAHRYGLRVCLAPTPGGGTTALVTVPEGLVGQRSLASVPDARPTQPGRARTSDGLVRRVPGAGLPAALRQQPVPVTAPVPAQSPVAAPAPPPTPTGAAGAAPPRISEALVTQLDRTASMLTRFQASQRAGRAVADTPPGSLAPSGDRRRAVTQEEP